MSSLPLVSIIIPVYNSEPYLKRCMNSVIAQTYRNIEILTIDDGSADKSGAILDEYAAKDKRVKVTHQENKGQGAARNAALDAAAGEWIVFADSDDMCAPDMVRTMLKRAICTNSDICWGEYMLHHMYYKTDSKIRMPEGVFEGSKIIDMFYREPSAPSMVWAAVYRKEILNGLRFPEGRIHEDTWLLPRLLGNAKRVTFLNRPVYHYFRRNDGTCESSSVAKKMDLLWAKKETVRYITSNFPEYKEYANKKMLESCCYILYHIDRANRKKHFKYWKQAISEFETAEKNIRNPSLVYKGIIFMFKLSPVLLAKSSGIYPFLKYETADILRCFNSPN